MGSTKQREPVAATQQATSSEHIGRRSEQPPGAYERALVDFVHTALRGRLQLAARSLDRELFRETPEVIGQLLIRGALRFLLYQGGWRLQRTLGAEKPRQARIWEIEDFDTLDVRLGARSVLLTAELLDNALRAQIKKGAEISRELRDLVKQIRTRGSVVEQIAAHLLVQPFLDQPRFDALVSALAPASCLSSVCYGAWPRYKIERPLVDDVATLQDHLGWTMPWLASHFASAWIAADREKLTNTLEAFEAVVTGLRTILARWVERALEKERHDWLRPVLEFFARAYNQEDFGPQLELLGQLSVPVNLSRRQGVRDQWGELLRVMVALDRERARIHREHPIDREPAEQLFLSWWQDMNMAEVHRRVEALRVQLERVVG